MALILNLESKGLPVLAARLAAGAQQGRWRGVFVTGSDTGVGKTVVTCALLRELSGRIPVAGLKPIACGGREDAEAFAGSQAMKFSVATINPVHLPKPMSPLAQKRPGWSEMMARIRRSLRKYDEAGVRLTLVEGAGGWLCPIDERHAMRELALALKLPVLVVAANRLGSLNHVLLTLESLKGTGLACVGVVMNCFDDWPDLSKESNAAWVARLGRLPVYICGKNGAN
ncbi:MAG: dethiobiotin synthase [Verrucomicrobiae bacterium]|nr:dethiobiotin synthase [Verrucomicrobiae bacterium]